MRAVSGKPVSDRRGSVSVEAGLVLGLLVVPMLLGAWDLGLVLRAQARLDAALHAVTLLAWATANASTGLAAAPLQAAVNGGANGLPVSVGTPSYACRCVDAHGTATSTLLGLCLGLGLNLCPSGQQTAQYVTLSLVANVPLPVAVPFLPNPVVLTNAATVRIQ